MSRWYLYEDPYEFERLERENEYLYEQVRTLSAELNERHRADYIVIKNGDKSLRPPYVTAASRSLVTDEAVSNSHIDALGFAVEKMHRQIEKLAADDERKPLDFMWRITLERDYKA